MFIQMQRVRVTEHVYTRAICTSTRTWFTQVQFERITERVNTSAMGTSNLKHLRKCNVYE